MKALGLDVGDLTIGVSVSDDLMISATGVTTIKRTGIKKDTGAVIDLINEYGTCITVIGMPFMMDGSVSAQGEKILEFKEKLTNKISSMGIKNHEVVLFDERFTTSMAEKVLIEGNLSRKKRKEVIDKQAAVIILQGFLDRVNFQKKEAGY